MITPVASQESLEDRFSRLLIERRLYFIVAVVLITVVLGFFAPRITLDPSIRAIVAEDSEEYQRYKTFLDDFGSDEFIVAVVKRPEGMGFQDFIGRVDGITNELDKNKTLDDVLSIANLNFFMKEKGLYGTEPVLANENGRFVLPVDQEMDKIREALPVTDLLLTKDKKHAGIVVTVPADRREDVPYIREVKGIILDSLKSQFPDSDSFRLTGMPIITDAIQRYTLQVVLYFSSIALVIGLLISIYIFKGIKQTVGYLVVTWVSAIWMIGLMAIFGIPLTSINGLAYGMVIILNLSGTIHVVTHFYKNVEASESKADAGVRTVRQVGRPLVMCAVTTAVGFACLMTATSPAVKDMGAVMALGCLVSITLVLILTPAILIVMKPVDKKNLDRASQDFVASAFNRMRHFVFSRPTSCVVAGSVFTIIMLAGIPMIKPDPHFFRLLVSSTDEIKNFQYVEDKVNPIQTLEISLHGEEGTFKEPGVWRRVDEMETALKKVPGIEGTNSILSTIKYLRALTAKPGEDLNDIFTKEGLALEFITITSMDSEGGELIERHLSPDYSKLRVSVIIRNFSDVPIGRIVGQIKSIAENSMGDVARPYVTGYLEAYASHSTEMVGSQARSLLLAIIVVTLAMVIQFRSFGLGLVSLIPNLVPVAAALGVMGWFSIPLNIGTMVVATITVGLAVDDTIHYLTQVRREMVGNDSEDSKIETILQRAFDVTGRALISTSAVLFFAFLSLVTAPFQPSVMFGLLGAIAVLVALLADLAFMPPVIIKVGPIRKMLGH